MKAKLKWILAVALALAIAMPLCVSAKKKENTGESQIKFVEAVHDFGKIKEDGGPVSYEFEFVNTGDGNLAILEATAQCGCTRPEYPKNLIAPGKKNKIKVTYNPIGRPGPFEKVVTVKTNGKPRKARLKITGEVISKN